MSENEAVAQLLVANGCLASKVFFPSLDIFDPPGKDSVPFVFLKRQLWLVLGVKLMEINSNLFSRQSVLGKIFHSNSRRYGSVHEGTPN